MLNGAAPSSTGCPNSWPWRWSSTPAPSVLLRGDTVGSALCSTAGITLGSIARTIPVIPWPLWDQGTQEVGWTAGADTLNTGPAYIWPTAQSKPCQHDGHSASTWRGHPIIGTLWHSSLWSHRAGLPRNDLTWSDLRVAPQSCFNNISYFFPPGQRHWRGTPGAPNAERRGGRRGQGCAQQQLWGRQTCSLVESQCIFSTMKRIPETKKGASAPPRLLATSPRQAPRQPNCHCVRYCENGNHFLSSKPEVSIPSLQDVIRKEGEKNKKEEERRKK